MKYEHFVNNLRFASPFDDPQRLCIIEGCEKQVSAMEEKTVQISDLDEATIRDFNSYIKRVCHNALVSIRRQESRMKNGAADIPLDDLFDTVASADIDFAGMERAALEVHGHKLDIDSDVADLLKGLRLCV